MRHVRPAPTAAAEPVPDFDTFFAIEYRRLFEVLYLLTRDRAEAEDLAQEAMARAYERWSRIRDPTRYVYRTAFNLHRTLRRRVAVAVRKRAELLPVADHPDVVERRLDALAALAALALLPATQRAAVVLVDWAGMTAEEAARVLGIQPVSVRGRLHRARAALRQRIGDADG
jgi:RNA polymerase sigma-70 factor (ECF subfamily)